MIQLYQRYQADLCARCLKDWVSGFNRFSRYRATVKSKCEESEKGEEKKCSGKKLASVLN